MHLTDHAIERFKQRYPHLDLSEEADTFRPASKSVMKKILLNRSRGSIKSNRLNCGTIVMVSEGGAVAACRDSDEGLVAATFLTIH